jgi:hypothetical protein
MGSTRSSKPPSAAFAAHVKLLVPPKLPIARPYRADAVVYEGQVVTHRGGTFQAMRDTPRPPPHDDWVCLASPGRDGVDGRTPTVRETYHVNQKYQRLDIVAMDGASFIARRDNPGIPGDGDGWQLLARQGRGGRKGERGRPGDKGEKGAPGRSLVSWQIDRTKYRASPLWSDGTIGPNLEMHGLYEQFQQDTDG